MSWPVAELDRRLAALIQQGVVEEVILGNPGASPPIPARVRVRVDEWVSAPLPFQSPSAGGVRIWNPPVVGEQVTMLSPSGEVGQGFVIGGFYTDSFNAPDSSAHTLHIAMPDGCTISYNHSTGAMSIHGTTSINIHSGGTITLDADVSITGDLTLPNGNVTVSAGDVTAQTVSLHNHIHTNTQSGSGFSGTPKP